MVNNLLSILLVNLFIFCLTCKIKREDSIQTSSKSSILKWQQLNGPFGGNISSIDINPINTDEIFLVSDRSFLYKSTDAGSHWRLIKSEGVNYYLYELWYRLNYKEAGISGVALNPSNPKVVYLWGDSGVLISSDSGENWESTLTMPVHHLLVHPKDTDVIYALLADYLIRSVDGGRNWEYSSFGEFKHITVYTIVTDPQNSNIIYIGTSEGIFKSDNAGEKWVKIATFETHTMVVTPKKVIYAGTADGRLYKYSDDGLSWQLLEEPEKGIYTNSLYLDPTDSNVIYASTDFSIVKSADGGMKWEPVEGIQKILTLTIDPKDNNKIYVGTPSGIFKSIDGGKSWKSISHGIILTDVCTLLVAPSNPNTIYALTCSGDDLFVSKDGGNIWNSLISSSHSATQIVYLVIDPKDGKIMYALVNVGHSLEETVFKTIDGGKSWENMGLKNFYLHSLAIDSNDTNIIYVAAEDKIFKSENGGRLWEIIKSSDDRNVSFSKIAVDPSDGKNIYVLASKGLYISNDKGKTWEYAHLEIKPISIAIAPSDSSSVYVGTQKNGVLVKNVFIIRDGSTKSFNVWVQPGPYVTLPWGYSNEGLTSPFVMALAVDRENADGVWAGTVIGLFRSEDGAKTWRCVGLCDKSIYSLAISPTGTIYAATSGGIYKSENLFLNTE